MKQMGLIGLGVMGRNLAFNLADHGVHVVGCDPAASSDLLPQGQVVGDEVTLVGVLTSPRVILMLIPAGAAVDQQVQNLLPLLHPGDVVVDGGNSHYADTVRRAAVMAERGITFMGMGISGGAEGARHGPAMMADTAMPILENMLGPVAAKFNGTACFGSFGGAGAGHFVKMIHNGIEYADMQLIAEAVYVLRHGAGLSLPAIGDLFDQWNSGPLASYLMEITAKILHTAENRMPLLDLIVDAAGQKGTGFWAVTAAMELGVPVPTLSAAVDARNLSAQRDLRSAVLACGRGPYPPPDAIQGITPHHVRDALLAGKVCAYAQGFSVLAAARRSKWPNMDLGLAAGVWRGGCIIRSQLLGDIKDALTAQPDLPSLVLVPSFAGLLAQSDRAVRTVVGAAVTAGLPVPALASVIAYADGLHRPRLWADVIQAQRDYFGAHGFLRLDRDGVQHGPWGDQR